MKKSIKILKSLITIMLLTKLQLFTAQDFSTEVTFSKPYIDKKEWRNSPVKHLYIHGGFEGTDTRFSFYFPEKQKYEGRFFQYITPAPDNENLSQGMMGEEDKIGFAISSGAYFVETNGGGNTGKGKNPLIATYIANAETAKYSRLVAKELFGEHRVYGYSFGGSGGGYRTIGGIENTSGVWDGAVPYVIGSPMAIPNVFTVRMHAMRILDKKFPQIINALEPGGNGNIYAGLTEEEKNALSEVTKMGFPPQSWFGYKTMGVHGFSAVYPGMVSADPGYFKDFWEKPGYLGFDHLASFKHFRLKKESHIKKLILEKEAVEIGLIAQSSNKERGTAEAAWKGQGQNEKGEIPVAVQLTDLLPAVQFLGGDLIVKSGAAKGKIIPISAVSGDKITIGIGSFDAVALLKEGDSVEIDNSNFLAAQTYHRHQVPSAEYTVWDQFRNSENKPIYPQRPHLIAPSFTKAASGILPTGKIKGKVIILSSLWDREAFPWQGDWYFKKIASELGDRSNENSRLWYVDHALHGDLSQQEDPTHTISYLGVLQQALHDLSQWVEKGIEPPATTRYDIQDGQVQVPLTAGERRGIQPTVQLLVKEKKAATVKTGKPVKLKAIIETPKNTGKIVKIEWNFDGSKHFENQENFKTNQSNVTVFRSHIFNKPGTYFVTVRVTSQREGNKETPYTKIQNLDRVRIIVEH